MIPPPDRAALEGPPEEVAPRLLGWRVTHETALGPVTVRLTEVEAYGGEDDPASHAWRGRSTRNAVMYGPAGQLYVYRSHGLHWCANVVTGPDGHASAVLLRAGRVLDGMELARRRRGGITDDDRLARGPGALGQALGLDGSLDGADLLSPASPLRLIHMRERIAVPVASGPRVGVSRAAEVPWRFWWLGERSVSAYRRSTRATRTEQ